MNFRNLTLCAAMSCWMLASCNNGSTYNNNNNMSGQSRMDTSMAYNDNNTMNNNNMSNGSMSDDAADFMREAYSGGMMEVAVGKLAQTNTNSTDVNEMGKMLVNDHTKLDDELKALAMKDGVSLPDNMMDKNQDTYDKLAKLHGNDFDEKFAKTSEDDHEADIDAFNSHAKTVTDPELSSWIKNALPVLQKHLDHARMLDHKYN